MAEGHVYVMEWNDKIVKVGRSMRPTVRSKALGRLRILYTHPYSDAAHEIEHLAHKHLKGMGRHVEKELFWATLDEAVDAIRAADPRGDSFEPEPAPPTDGDMPWCNARYFVRVGQTVTLPDGKDALITPENIVEITGIDRTYPIACSVVDGVIQHTVLKPKKGLSEKTIYNYTVPKGSKKKPARKLATD